MSSAPAAGEPAGGAAAPLPPLPEAQADRFLLKLLVDYPEREDAEHFHRILKRTCHITVKVAEK